MYVVSLNLIVFEVLLVSLSYKIGLVVYRKPSFLVEILQCRLSQRNYIRHWRRLASCSGAWSSNL